MKTEKKKMILKMLSVFLVCGYAFVGQTTYLEAANGPYASNPDPADGAEIPGLPYPDPPAWPTHIWTMLIFNPGSTAVKHTGYFSEDYSKVYSRHQDANLGEPPYPYPLWDNVFFPGNPEVDPATDSLVRGTTYYWTVDETDGNNVVWQGPVWNFYVQSYYATRPDPPNEAININPNVLLCWEPGLEVDFHDFYLGTSWEAVNNAIRWDLTGIYQGWTYEPNWPCSGLPTDTKIYWRVDEVHETFWEPDIYKGDVWSFTTAPKRIFVDVDANGANNGSSWANAYNYLQDALIEADSALKPVEIRVAEGIYTPDSNSADPNGSGDRIATFKLIDGVTLKGGYAGYGEANPNARDIELYETILSGDLDGNDVEVNDPCDLLSEPTRAENSYHVVAGDRQGWPDTTVVVDGFTITGGNSNGDFPAGERTGGGMNFCSGKIINCTITGNSAMWGGGMCYSVGEIINCNIKRNFVSGRGGGISYSDVQMTNCTISENSAVQGGGGINNTAGDMMLTNCIFKGNTAREGGAIWYIDGKFGVQTLVNCTFSGNLAEMGGGAIYLSDYSSPTLINCILWGNSYPEIHGTAVVTYSDVEGGWPGLGNIDAYPCFADAYNGDYHLKSQAGRWEPSSESWVQDYVSSPCIDAGNPGCPLGDEPVPNGNQRNMGAYGGTAEASKSPPNWRSIADLTNDWVVDSNDLRIYVDYWLESGECIPSDFDRSQFVDFNDFAIFGLQWSYPTAFEPGMTFQIDDCNMEYGPSWTVVAESNEPRFSVWVEGRYIYFEDLMYANCCPEELGLDKEINGNEITLYEIGYGGLCDCMCYFPITATLGPFEDGTYTVEVYDNYGNSLGVVEVTIGGSTGPGLAYQIKDCNREASVSFTAEPPEQTRFTVTVEGLYIHFKDMMYANCCPDELELEMTVEDNLITIYEIEYTSEGCRCMCSFPITATLGPFEPGAYTLEVYEHHGGFIGSTTVVIDPPQ